MCLLILIFIHSMLQFLLTFVERKSILCCTESDQIIYRWENVNFASMTVFIFFWFGSISTRFDIGFLWFYFITFRFVSTRTFSLCCILFCFFLIKRILLNFALKNKNKPRYTYKKFVFFLLFTRFWPYRLKQIAFVRLHILLANINWNAEVN